MLTSCASVYIPPTEGSTAQLSEFDPSSVSVSIYDDSIGCQGVAHPLRAAFSKQKNQFITIPANKPLTINVYRYNGGKYNGIFDVITFTPEAGKKYTIQNKITEISPVSIRSALRVLKVIGLDNGESFYISTRYYKRNRPGYAGRCIDHELKNKLKLE